MPTFFQGQAQPPGSKRTVDDAMLWGQAQWQPTWRAFARQWSQPALIKLAEQTLGCRALHSSQINGWTRGSLRDPSPKLLTAVGWLNLAIAASNGDPVASDHKCPGHLEDLWKYKRWLTCPDGTPMGPALVFQAVAGLIDLQLNLARVVPPASEAAASKALGRYLRLSLSRAGVDWLEALPELRERSDVIEELLMGKTIDGTRLVESLEELASLSGTTSEELWNEVAGELS